MKVKNSEGFTIQLPLNDFTTDTLDYLSLMIYGKAYIIRKALGATSLLAFAGTENHEKKIKNPP